MPPPPVPITCHLACLGAIEPDIMAKVGTSIPISGGGDLPLDFLFHDNSDSVIQLAVNPNRLQTPARTDLASVTSFDLHEYTQAVTGNSPERRFSPLENIAVIYTNVLKGHPELRGLMFDIGFISEFEDATAEQFKACPREACAVFLHPIRASRTEKEWRDQIAYTTTHELGHVFNLQHSTEFTYLRTSPSDTNPDRSCFRFTAAEQAMLRNCNSDAIYPGGLAFTDVANHGSGDSTRGLTRRGRSPLNLEIGLSATEFLPCEPVEIDLRLSVKPNTVASLRVADHADPAYGSFIIWIEDPIGERRRYRPIHHACDNHGTLEITPRDPFQRDIPVFGQSGGYTFRRPGDYNLWITWRLNERTTLKSNTVAFHIRAQERLNQHALKMCQLLRIAGRPLFYRDHRFSHREMNALRALGEDCNPKSWPYAVQMARYARYRLDLHRASKTREPVPGVRRTVAETSRRLADSEALGAYRRHRVRQLWDATFS